MRIAVLDRKKCNPEKCGYLCIKFCPGVRLKKETIIVGEDGFPIINENLCTGCGICVKKCPYGAIHIENLPEALGNPFHQYGKNGFRVFGFPIPRHGIIGIVGPNGIGKTTLLNIMAGRIIPNLGKGIDNWEELLKEVKNRELNRFFADVMEKKVKVAYKIQEITKLRELNVKVKDVVPSHFKRELEPIWERPLSHLSGGELQKVAIFAVLGREADLYFFDEPSSYLDIQERLNIAKKLRGVEKAFVVEHDLALLDYLVDYVYIMYGKPGVYGIVSQMKSGRVGINEFLDGYLKEENVRIRDHAIKFEVKKASKEWKGRERIVFNAFLKKYDGFELEVKGGDIIVGEVVGILGPNGIGKTTFLKVLAGIERATKGDPGLKVKVAYKPQYLERSFEGKVRDLRIGSNLRMLIKGLEEKEIKDLSGGELQKVAIAYCLNQEADLYLLDEPSAFLDIEERFRVARIVKQVAEKKEKPILVVDHDIVFIDFIANRIMVFEGTPGRKGIGIGPLEMADGMNRFLKNMGITFRRDVDTKRPRMNKPGSQKDIEQKTKGQYYYVE